MQLLLKTLSILQNTVLYCVGAWNVAFKLESAITEGTLQNKIIHLYPTITLPLGKEKNLIMYQKKD